VDFLKYAQFTNWTRDLKHAARDGFWEFSHNYHLRYLVYSPLFESVRLASEQVSFEQT